MSEAGLYSLNEAAELTGLSVDALRQRIKRRKIHAVRGNDGLVRVRLDAGGIEALKASRPPSRPPSQPTEQSPAISALQDHITTLREQLAAADTRTNEALADLRAERKASSERAAADADERRRLIARIGELEERAEKAEQRELARLAAQNHPPATDFTLPDAALEAIRADLESEELPSKELHGPSDSGQRTRLAEALDIIRMELDGPMSNEPVPSAASAKPGRLDGVAAIRSAMDGNDEEEGRGSDDPVMPDGATSPETRAEPIKELPAVTAIASAPLLPESRWWSRFVPRRRRRTT